MTANPRGELLVERGFILLSKQTYLQLLNGSTSKGPLAMDKSEQTRLKGAKLRILYTPLIDAVRIQQLSMSNWGSNMKIVYKIHKECLLLTHKTIYGIFSLFQNPSIVIIFLNFSFKIPVLWTSFQISLFQNPSTVKPPISDHPKCKDWVVAYGRWSFTRIKPQGVSSEKRSRHIYFMQDNSLHAMFKLGYA